MMASAEKRRVLLVDDNEATRTLITAILQRDFLVESAFDGLEAIEKLRTNRYTAILLDLRMPEYDGFSVLEFLKTNHPEVLPSVLVVTASLTARDMNRARSYGVCDIVTKPFDIEALLEAVRRCAGDFDNGGRAIFATTPMLLLLADLLRNKIC
jgi:CheY-like chemotaxis protein